MPTWTWYGEPIYRYRDERGRFVGQAQVQGWADIGREASLSGLDALAERLSERAISVEEWQTEMRDRIKREALRQYLIGRGGVQQMTSQDYGSLGGVIADQYRYLDGFAREIADGLLSERQIVARSRMYLRSTREAFERAMARTRGLPAMPAYPGDASTACYTNCQCHWDYHYLPSRRRWECTWMLGEAEHCEDCVANAALWNPLVIQEE